MSSIPDDAVRTIYNGRIEDARFSANGAQLYAVAANALLEIDRASGAVLRTWDVGQPLGPLDLSVDGRYLITAAYPSDPIGLSGPPPGQGTIYRIDTQTGAIQSFVIPEGHVSDLAYLDDGTALIAYRRTTFLDIINFSTAAVGGDINVQSVSSPLLETSQDHEKVLILESDLFHTSRTYLSGIGLRGQHLANPDPYAGASVSTGTPPVGTLSPSGTLAISDGVVLASPTFFENGQVVSTDLVPAGSIPVIASGMVFSPSGDKLYAVRGDTIYVIDTTDWILIGSYQLDASTYSDPISGNLLRGFGDILEISPDGRHLSAITVTGLEVVDTSLFPPGGTAGDDVLTGIGLLFGLAGNDTLGGAGDQTMYGGRGDDAYLVDSFFDQVNELPGQGHDRVLTTISFSLPDNVEEASFTGTGAAFLGGNTADNVLTGGAGGDTIVAGAGNDQLFGLGGNDTLDGESGNDTLTGGAGNDLYYADGGDTIVELAGEGSDEVRTRSSFTLPANVENLTAEIGTGLVLTGNSRANVVRGGDGADTLNGGLGADTLVGGAGSDVFTGTRASLSGDTIVDLAMGEKIHITDANPAGFISSLTGSVLTYTGGTLNLTNLPANTRLKTTAAAGGGVDLSLSINTPPDAVNDSVVNQRGIAVTISVKANDIDAEGDALTIASVGTPLHGSAVLNPDGTITYTPVEDYRGADSFTYTVSDGFGGTDTATVSIGAAPKAQTILTTGQTYGVSGFSGFPTDVFVTGTAAGAEVVTVGDYTGTSFSNNFSSGGDTIRVLGAAVNFQVALSGNQVSLTSAADHTTIQLPAGFTATTLAFETAPGVFGDTRTLRFVADGADGDSLPDLYLASQRIMPGVASLAVEAFA